MPSLLRSVPGRQGFEIRFHLHGDRYVLWIGKLTVRQQREYERHVQSLIDSAKVGATPEPVSVHWFDSVPDRIRDRFVAWEMLPARQRRTVSHEQRTIEGWTRLFIDELTVCGRTKNNYEQARSWLLKSIDGKRDLSSVTAGDLKRWQASMNRLALSTRNKHVKRVKTMFAGAVEDGILSANPASILKEERSAKRVDRSRQYFVDSEQSKRVMDSLPGIHWKLIFTLMRFQGLRRHEVFAIDWSNIDLTTNELTIPAETKTGWRSMPIFPETLSLLRSIPERSRRGKLVVWTKSPESVTELLKRHVTAILGECWPKVCQQLRSTRRTELDGEFEPFVVNEWLGHDGRTAEHHYQQITPAHLARAAMMRTVPDEPITAVRTAACTAERHSNGENRKTPTQKNPGKSMISRAGRSQEYPRKDSNLGPAD
jgi:integrase